MGDKTVDNPDPWVDYKDRSTLHGVSRAFNPRYPSAIRFVFN